MRGMSFQEIYPYDFSWIKFDSMINCLIVKQRFNQFVYFLNVLYLDLEIIQIQPLFQKEMYWLRSSKFYLFKLFNL